MITRETAEIQIDEIRMEHLDNGTVFNDLAGVSRALFDGHPLADTQSALTTAAYQLPIEITRQVRTILNDTQEN